MIHSFSCHKCGILLPIKKASSGSKPFPRQMVFFCSPKCAHSFLKPNKDFSREINIENEKCPVCNSLFSIHSRMQLIFELLELNKDFIRGKKL